MADANPQHVVVEEPRAGLFSNIVAVVGLIILIVIVIWGLLHLASLSRGWLSFLFNRAVAKVEVTAPANATSSIPFSISWKYSTSEKGNYAFLYQCRAGLSLKAGSGASIPCGAAYTVGGTTSLSMTPTFAGATSTSLPITVIFLPSATTSPQAQGSATIAVHAASVSTPTPTAPETPTTPSTPVKPAVSAPVYRGPADLSVRILNIGVIDPYSGQFVNRVPGPNDVAAAQFDIANEGGSASGTYYFTATLPTMSGYVYSSPAQAPLGVGSHVLSTLRWSDGNPGGGTFSVSITGSDSNSSNNYASRWISGGYYVPQPYYPYQY
ncbi:hypothetical protein HY968_04155 [Candidatus Kaiserbacteria bacterium]|nr:hypothetical protein [Candidatus Kaiserbacteria bacterium]